MTEFYLLGEDGLRIVAEVENIGPNLNRELTVNAPAGSYVTACKPGMKGEGIRADFTVTESDADVGVDADDQALVDQATANYAAYVEDQSAQLLEKTTGFVELYKSGDDDAARELYADARTHWERIETVAESFGDLDPKMDAREADLEPGAEFTGWHRIEKDLWPARAEKYAPLTDQERAFYADDLLDHTTELDTRVQDLTYTIDQIANGSRGLLEEVADRQGHRRGGVLVADRPVGLPGERRRRAGRLRRACSRSSSRRTRSWPTSSTPGSPSCSRCSTRTGWATGSSSTTS